MALRGFGKSSTFRVGPAPAQYWVRFLLGVSGEEAAASRKGRVQAQGLVRGRGRGGTSLLLSLQGRS